MLLAGLLGIICLVAQAGNTLAFLQPLCRNPGLWPTFRQWHSLKAWKKELSAADGNRGR